MDIKIETIDKLRRAQIESAKLLDKLEVSIKLKAKDRHTLEEVGEIIKEVRNKRWKMLTEEL